MPRLQLNEVPGFLATFNMGRISWCMTREKTENKHCILNLEFSQDTGVTCVSVGVVFAVLQVKNAIEKGLEWGGDGFCHLALPVGSGRV